MVGVAAPAACTAVVMDPFACGTSCGASWCGGSVAGALSRLWCDGEALPKLNLPTIPSQRYAGQYARRLWRWREPGEREPARREAESLRRSSARGRNGQAGPGVAPEKAGAKHDPKTRPQRDVCGHAKVTRACRVDAMADGLALILFSRVRFRWSVGLASVACPWPITIQWLCSSFGKLPERAYKVDDPRNPSFPQPNT